MRVSTRRYVDPLDAIWLVTIAKVGFRVERSADVYASTDGAGVLTLGDAATLDPDDCLAQMVFHELCHSLVQGRAGLREVDWGLSNLTDDDVPREHATLRVQAALAGAHGLREVLAPTTDFRAFYDALPDDPLDGDDASVPLAREALARADEAPWGPHLREALRATERVLEAVRDVGAAEAAPSGGLPSLLATFSPRSGRAGT